MSIMSDWINLQTLLKNQYISMINEQEQKNILYKKLIDSTVNFHRSQIQLRSIADKKGKEKEKRLFQDQGFGDSYIFIKEIVLILSKNPKIMRILIEKNYNIQNLSSLQSLSRLIATSMYQNVVDDNLQNKDIFLLIESMLVIIIGQKKHTEIDFTAQTFPNLILKEFMQRTEMKTYIKQVTRNTLLEIAKIDKSLDFKTMQENQKNTKRKTKICSSNNFQYQGLYSNQKGKGKSQKISKIKQYSQALKIKDAYIKQIGFKQKSKYSISPELMSYLGLSQIINFPSFVSQKCGYVAKKQQQINRQWSIVLSRGDEGKNQSNIPDIQTTKNIIIIFFSDVFKTLYSMPSSIRIISRIIYNIISQKHPTNKKAPLQVVANFIFTFWMSKYIGFDKDLIESGRISSNLVANSTIICQIINGIVKNQTKTINAKFMCCFNEIMVQLRTSLYNYLNQLININQYHKISSEDLIKSYSVCLSLRDIENLMCLIKNTFNQNTNEEIGIKLLKRVKRIQQMNKDVEKNIFGQKLDKQIGKTYKPENAYVLFTQFCLPKQLSFEYFKYYSDCFKNNKIKNLIRLVLLNFDDLTNYCESGFNELAELLNMLVQNQQYGQLYCIGEIPNQIKIKYLLTIAKKIKLQTYLPEMHKQAKQRQQNTRKIGNRVKQCYLKAISNVGLHIEKVSISQNNIKLQSKRKLLQQFLQVTAINVCLTSPKSRQNELVLKTNLLKDVSEEEKSKLWLQNQTKCMHTVLNLQFMASFTGETDKKSKYESHCNSIMKFPQILCSLPEIRQRSSFWRDDYLGIRQVFSEFIQYCIDIVRKKQEYTILLEDEKWLEENLQQRLSKKIYQKIYPKQPTYQDIALYLRLKTLKWLSYQHLKIQQSLRLNTIWDIAASNLRLMDKMKTAGEKLSCIVQSSKTILNSYRLANPKDQPATADDIYPIVIYVVLRAGSKRLLSNINFIELFGNEAKLKSRQGYFFTQLKSAIHYCDSLDNESIGMEMVQFNRCIYEQQIDYGIYFLLSRPKHSPKTIHMNISYIKQKYLKDHNQDKKIQEIQQKNILVSMDDWVSKQLEKKKTNT